MPNDFIMEIANRGVATVGNVGVQLYYSDPTLVENVPGTGVPFGSTTVPAIAPGQTVQTSPVVFMPPTSNSFGQHYFTFGVRAQCVGDTQHDEWVEFDNDIACKGEHRVQVSPFSGTLLQFWAGNPRSQNAYVVVKMDKYLPSGWTAQLAPAGMDSVLLPAGATQQRTLMVDAGSIGIGMVDVYELTYDIAGNFLGTTGGLSFLVWTTGTDVPEGDVASDVALAAPSPNPAAGSTELTFTLPAEGPATLSVYDVSGRLVARPFAGPADAGATRVAWDCRDSNGQNLASGVYFVKLEAAGRSDVRKIVVVR
jgi:hypothetical protein